MTEPTLQQRAKARLHDLETLRREWSAMSHDDRAAIIEEARDLIEEMGAALYGANWDAEEET